MYNVYTMFAYDVMSSSPRKVKTIKPDSQAQCSDSQSDQPLVSTISFTPDCPIKIRNGEQYNSFFLVVKVSVTG